MADIIDYLIWRGDVPFSADPFGEVDNLILAELSYMKFEGIVPSDGTEIPLWRAAEEYLALYPPEERSARSRIVSSSTPQISPGAVRTHARSSWRSPLAQGR